MCRGKHDTKNVERGCSDVIQEDWTLKTEREVGTESVVGSEATARSLSCVVLLFDLQLSTRSGLNLLKDLLSQNSHLQKPRTEQTIHFFNSEVSYGFRKFLLSSSCLPIPMFRWKLVLEFPLWQISWLNWKWQIFFFLGYLAPASTSSPFQISMETVKPPSQVSRRFEKFLAFLLNFLQREFLYFSSF